MGLIQQGLQFLHGVLLWGLLLGHLLLFDLACLKVKLRHGIIHGILELARHMFLAFLILASARNLDLRFD